MRLFIFVAALLLTASVAAADEHYIDRDLLFVNTTAEAIVPVNALRMTFRFDMNAYSLEETARRSEKITGEITAVVHGLGIKDVQVYRGWDLLKDGKIAMGNKGRQVTNTVVVEMQRVPPEKLFEVIAVVADKAVAADQAVVLEGIETYLTPDAEAARKAELNVTAGKQLAAEANQVAAAAGFKILQPHTVYLGAREAQALLTEDDVTAGLENLSAMNATRVGEISPHVKLKVRVSGAFEIGK